MFILQSVIKYYRNADGNYIPLRKTMKSSLYQVKYIDLETEGEVYAI